MSRLGIDMKFGRALEVLRSLEEHVEQYLAGEPFQLEEVEEAESGDLVTRVWVRVQPPMEWSVLVGDAVHNARSALDHLACALVERDGGTVDENTCFPIADAASGYGDRLRRGLLGASLDSRNALRALQPYKGGDDRLWKLHRLDIIDKHRLLVAVGAANKSVGMTFQLPGFPSITVDLVPEDKQFPIQDGAVVFRVPKHARDEAASSIGQLSQVAFEVAFGDGTVVNGEPLAATLRELIEHAATVVEPLVETL